MAFQFRDGQERDHFCAVPIIDPQMDCELMNVIIHVPKLIMIDRERFAPYGSDYHHRTSDVTIVSLVCRVRNGLRFRAVG